MAVSPYSRRIEDIAREMGIPSDYGQVRKLSPQPEADTLVAIALNNEGQEIRLIPAAAAAWERMKAAAAADRITLLPLSGFRSVERQVAIIREKRIAGASLKEILHSVAAPGFSEHHTGRALDVGAPDEPPLVEGFALTTAFAWMVAHAGKFGFRLSYPKNNPHGFIYEPWHWFYQE